MLSSAWNKLQYDQTMTAYKKRNINKRLGLSLLVGLSLACKLFTPMPTPSETATIPAPTNTQTATQTPLPPSATPTIPLTQNGPWMLFQPPSVDQPGGSQVVLTNLDGSGRTRLDLPTLFETLAVSPNGQYAAVRITDPGQGLEAQTLNASLWVIALPDGRVVRRIRLLGSEARQWLAENPPEEFQGLSSTILGAPYLWSPDGRYLAFSGALDGESTDVYLYDLAEDQTIQLTDGSKQAVIHSWSPDGRWVIHEASLFYQPQDRVIYSTWAASIDGEVNRLVYGPFNQHPIIGWLTSEKLLTYTRRSIGSSEELRTVDLLSGRTEFIYNQPFFEAGFDPHSDSILINQQPLDYASADSLPGIYTLDIENETLALLLPGRFEGLSWEAPLENFLAVEDGHLLIVFDHQGEKNCSLLFPQNGQIGYSPDRNWMVISGPEGGKLYTTGCRETVEFDQPGITLWLPDSSGVVIYQITQDGRAVITRYLLDNDWQAELIAEDLPAIQNPYLILP
jgi:hypothetical protein